MMRTGRDDDAEPGREDSDHDSEYAVADRRSEMAVAAQHHRLQRQRAVGGEGAAAAGARTQSRALTPSGVVAEATERLQQRAQDEGAAEVDQERRPRPSRPVVR